LKEQELAVMDPSLKDTLQEKDQDKGLNTITLGVKNDDPKLEFINQLMFIRKGVSLFSTCQDDFLF
jgi:hypothetical protein